MKPSNVKEMLRSVMRDRSVVIKGNIDRANVSINVTPYKLGKDCDWLPVAKETRDLVAGEKAIVY